MATTLCSQNSALFNVRSRLKANIVGGGGVEYAVPPAPHSLYSLPPSRQKLVLHQCFDVTMANKGTTIYIITCMVSLGNS